MDPKRQLLSHAVRSIPIERIDRIERCRRFGFLHGIRVVEDGGRESLFVIAARGTEKVEALLDAVVGGVADAAHRHWTKAFARSLSEVGEIDHRGVRITVAGEISDGGSRSSIAVGRFSHEIDGEILRLKFQHEDVRTVVDWKPGLARNSALALIYDLRERRRILSRSRRETPETHELRLKARERIAATTADLAAVMCRTDVMSGRAKLAAFCDAEKLPRVHDRFLENAHMLLVRKSFIQKSFEDIQRYNRRVSQAEQSPLLFEKLVRLAEHEGRLNTHQLFAVYEIGLHLGYSLPRITAMVAAILSGGDPWNIVEPEDIVDSVNDKEGDASGWHDGGAASASESEGLHEPAGDRRDDAGGYREKERPEPRDFPDFEDPPPVRRMPDFLLPMMEVLGLAEVDTERELRAAWTARVRLCHPDRLGPSATQEELEAATCETAEANMAYSVILDFLKASR